MFIDPTGMEFTERSMEMVNSLQKKAKENKIIEITTAVIALQLEKNINKAYSHIRKAEKFCEVINEINELKNSDTMYDVSIGQQYNTEDSYVGATKYNSELMRVEIIIPKSDILSLIAHELKHAYQFEIGKISLNGSLLYDQGDEIEAYYRGELFGGERWDNVKHTYKHLPTRRLSTKIKDKEFIDIINGKSFPKLSVFKYKNKIYSPQ